MGQLGQLDRHRLARLRVRYATVADLSSFDEIVDVRTPAEYELDHIPGAINAPVLSNAERVVIGTLYRTDPFGATRLGGALVAANIAGHLQTTFAAKPSNWRPVIYCWRGGKRSGSMSTWFNLIGWRAQPLAGGYKNYRRWVIEQLTASPVAFDWVVLHGLTGCGKTRLLQALAGAGAQILDLEALARHRGSLLGGFSDQPQPSQKAFDTALVATLAHFTRDQPVFVEAESRMIGSLRLPVAICNAIEAGTSVNVEASRDSRIAYLCHEYQHLFEDPAFFKAQLDRLLVLHGRAVIKRWHELIDAGDAATLYAELIDRHYDPAYRRGQRAKGTSAVTINLDPSGDLKVSANNLLRSDWLKQLQR
jgi:tRNA 2-selenouridine synthase